MIAEKIESGINQVKVYRNRGRNNNGDWLEMSLRLQVNKIGIKLTNNWRILGAKVK